MRVEEGNTHGGADGEGLSQSRGGKGEGGKLGEHRDVVRWIGSFPRGSSATSKSWWGAGGRGSQHVNDGDEQTRDDVEKEQRNRKEEG